MRWIIATCVVCVFSSPLFAQPVADQPIADRLPANTLVYVGWTPSDSVKDTLPAKLLADERLANVWRALFRNAVLDMPEDVSGPRLTDLIPQLLSDATHSPGCMAVLKLEMDKHNLAPEVVLMIDLGNRRKSFEEHFTPIHNRLKDRIGDRLHLMKLENSWLWLETNYHEKPVAAWGFIGDSFVYYRGANPEKFLPTLVAGHQPKALKDDPTFADAMAKLPGDSIVTTYCAAQPLLVLAAQQGLSEDNFAENLSIMAKWPQVAAELGVDNVKSLVEKTTVENGQYVTRSLLHTDGPPHGLLPTLIGPSVDDALLKCAPADSTFLLAERLDLGKLYDQIKTSSIAIGGDDMKRKFDEIEQAADAVQVPLKDALAPLGDQWLIYNAPSTGGGLIFFGTTLVVTIKDEKQMDHTLDVLTQLLAQNMSSEWNRVSVRSKTVDGVKISYLQFSEFSPFSPSWAVADGKLFVALYPQVCEDAISQAKAGTMSVLDNHDFVATRQHVGDGPLFYFSGPETLKTIYPFVPIVASAIQSELGREIMHNGQLGKADDGIDIGACIPSLRHALTLVGSDAAAVKVTPDGILKTQTQGNPLLSPLTFDSPALWIAATAPLLGDTEQRNQVISESRLRQLGQGCMLYANDNKQALPPDLGTLVLDESMTADIVISPDSETTVPADLAQRPREGQIAWINEHSDYVYLGAGQTNSTGNEIILAYEKLETHAGESTNVLFADSHVQFMTHKEFDKALEHSKELVARQKAPDAGNPAPDAPPPVVVPDTQPAVPTVTPARAPQY